MFLALLLLSRYTWDIYAKRLLTLSSVYSFWKHVSDLERRETKRYLEMLCEYRQALSAVVDGSCLVGRVFSDGVLLAFVHASRRAIALLDSSKMGRALWDPRCWS